MMNNDAFCVLPFTQIQIDHAPTVARPCCVFNSNRVISPQGYQNNAEIRRVKNHMLAGVKPVQCQQCHKQEADSGSSFRTSANESYPHLVQEIQDVGEDYHRIQNLILISSNICNLKCLPCEQGSYVRMRELNDLGLLKTPARPRKNTDMASYLEIDFQRLTISGGEPFYDNTWDFLSLLISSGRSQVVDLSINTNLTAITESQLQDLADNFRSVLILGSIDGVDQVNHYLRYPADWTDIERSVEMIQRTDGIEFMVTTALTNLALLRYPDLVRWMIERGIDQWYVTQVNQPSILSCSEFFGPHAQHVDQQLEELLRNLPHVSARTQESLEICRSLCQTSAQEPLFYARIKHHLDLHDQHRGTDWRQIWPELIPTLDG